MTGRRVGLGDVGKYIVCAGYSLTGSTSEVVEGKYRISCTGDAKRDSKGIEVEDTAKGS